MRTTIAMLFIRSVCLFDTAPRMRNPGWTRSVEKSLDGQTLKGTASQALGSTT